MSRPFDLGNEAGSGARGRAARFSLALGPAGGSLEYELAMAVADNARLRHQLANEQENSQRLQRELSAAESERRRLAGEPRRAPLEVRS